MKNNNPYGESIELFQKIAKTTCGDGFIVGVLRRDGDIDIGETAVSKDDYRFLTRTVIIDGVTVTIPSIEDQTVRLTYTHPHGIAPVEETKIIKFPKVPAGSELLMMQLEDGDYIVFGEV